jgi:deoxyribodipyrimidine photolyase-related protein
LKTIQRQHPNHELICAEPSSHRQFAQLEEFGARFIENDFFCLLHCVHLIIK